MRDTEGQDRLKTMAVTDSAPVSHAPPCETVASRGQGAALYKCLLAACGPAGAPHMFVLWSSHTDTGAFAGPRRPSWSRSCLFVLSVCLLSAPPITTLSSLFCCSMAAPSSDRSEVPTRCPHRQTGGQIQATNKDKWNHHCDGRLKMTQIQHQGH